MTNAFKPLSYGIRLGYRNFKPFLPVPVIANGKARTPDPAISPAKNMAAVITPRPCLAASRSISFFCTSLIWSPGLEDTVVKVNIWDNFEISGQIITIQLIPLWFKETCYNPLSHCDLKKLFITLLPTVEGETQRRGSLTWFLCVSDMLKCH